MNTDEIMLQSSNEPVFPTTSRWTSPFGEIANIAMTLDIVGVDNVGYAKKNSIAMEGSPPPWSHR